MIAQAPVVLILGDSLSAGYGVPLGQSWPELLRDRIKQEGWNYRIENASISGETTRGGAARLPSLLERHNPAVVLLELGANDGLRGVAIEEVERNFQYMLRLLQDHDVRVLLFEMRVLPNYGPAYARQFDELFARLGEQDSVRLVPFFLANVALNPELMQSDGLHPNAAAQRVILGDVWDCIADELGRGVEAP